MTAIVKRLPVIIFFVAFGALGIAVFKDYGVSVDEWNNRLNGGVSFKYIYSKLYPAKAEQDPVLKNLPNLQDHFDKDYGVAFDLPLFFIEWKLHLTGTPASVYLRHGFIFFLFFIAAIYFFLLLHQRLKNQYLALAGTLFLILSPRIFAHGFYNIKDHAFLSVFIISIYYLNRFFKHPSWKNVLLFGIASAFAINTRILGVLIPFAGGVWLLYGWLWVKFSKAFLQQQIVARFLVACVIMALTIFIIWPYLWESPVINFLKAFKHMAAFRWNHTVRLFGKDIMATHLPWYYIPAWMLVTIPLLYTILFFTGFFFIVRDWIGQKFRFDTTKLPLDAVMVFLFLFPLLIVIILKSVMYNDWRHMYFIYPQFVYIATVGLASLFETIRRNVLLKIVLASIIMINSLVVGYWMYRNHPNQYLYFSLVSPQKAAVNFDMDHWHLTNRPAYHYIATHEKDSCFILSSTRFDLFQCYQFLSNGSDSSKYKAVFSYPDKLTDGLLDSLTKQRKTYFLDNPDRKLGVATQFNLHPVFPVMVEGNVITQISEIKRRN